MERPERRGVDFHGPQRRRARWSGGLFGVTDFFSRGGLRCRRWRWLGGSRTAEGRLRHAQQENGGELHNQGKGESMKILTMSCFDVLSNGIALNVPCLVKGTL